MTEYIENMLSDFVIQHLEDCNSFFVCAIHTRLLNEVKKGALNISTLQQLHFNLGIQPSLETLH